MHIERAVSAISNVDPIFGKPAVLVQSGILTSTPSVSSTNAGAQGGVLITSVPAVSTKSPTTTLSLATTLPRSTATAIVTGTTPTGSSTAQPSILSAAPVAATVATTTATHSTTSSISPQATAVSPSVQDALAFYSVQTVAFASQTSSHSGWSRWPSGPTATTELSPSLISPTSSWAPLSSVSTYSSASSAVPQPATSSGTTSSGGVQDALAFYSVQAAFAQSSPAGQPPTRSGAFSLTSGVSTSIAVATSMPALDALAFYSVQTLFAPQSSTQKASGLPTTVIAANELAEPTAASGTQPTASVGSTPSLASAATSTLKISVATGTASAAMAQSATLSPPSPTTSLYYGAQGGALVTPDANGVLSTAVNAYPTGNAIPPTTVVTYTPRPTATSTFKGTLGGSQIMGATTVPTPTQGVNVCACW